MKISTENIIKTLPLEANLKEQMFNFLQNGDPDSKDRIIEIVWDTYYALYELMVEEEVQLALLKAGNNEEVLDENFYKRIRESVEQKMQQDLTLHASQLDLSQARNELQKLISGPN